MNSSTDLLETVSRLAQGHRTLADNDGALSPRNPPGDHIVSAKTAHRAGTCPRYRWYRPLVTVSITDESDRPARHRGACAAGRERPPGTAATNATFGSTAARPSSGVLDGGVRGGGSS
jgi:hypothetical protein